MSSLGLYLFAGAFLYWIPGELRKISIKHKSLGPCHPIMARSNGPGRRIIGMQAKGKKGRPGENNSANNTKQITGTTYCIHWPSIIEPRVRPAALRVFGISNNAPILSRKSFLRSRPLLRSLSISSKSSYRSFHRAFDQTRERFLETFFVPLF